LNPSSNDESIGIEERILVIRFSSLGDLLLTAPALRVLRSRFPQSRIELLVASEYAEAAALIPGVDQIHSFNRRRGLLGLWRLRGSLAGRHAVLIDWQNNFRSAFLRAFTFPTVWTKAKRYRLRRWLLIHFKWNLYRQIRPVPLRYLDALSVFGAEDDGRGLELNVPGLTRQWADAYCQSLNFQEKRFVMLCPGARHFTKRWPSDRWIETGRALSAQGFRMMVAGSAAEQNLLQEIASALPEAVVITDRSIPEVAALMQQAAAVVSHDSGLMHLAAGVGASLVAIFGPTVEEFGFYPFRARSELLSHVLNCRPCSAIGGPRCPQKHFRCMMDTSASAVVAAVQRLISKDQASLL
jgi:lipopolysaccharide heptosyltransferase II